MRTFIFLCCILLFSFTPKHSLSQNAKVVIDADKEVTVDEVFDIINSQTDYSFIYHKDLFKDFPKVELKKGVIRLNKLLNLSLSADDLNIIVTKNNIVLINKKTSYNRARQRTVFGTITDQSGRSVPDATVLIKGTSRGTATNLDGQYTIAVPSPENVLVFSSLGFESQEITVGSQTNINVSLKEDINELDAVELVGHYYKRDQRENPGNIFKIDAKTIEKQPVSNPLAAMQGYIPGVNITQATGLPGGAFNIVIRGKNFINAGTDPLYIVDGVPYNSESLGNLSFNNILPGESPLNLINPSDIESIEVLKDADATAIYGSRGANGVVLISTKKGKVGKTQMKANITTSLASVSRFVDLLNTEQYLEMREEALTNDGFTLETAPSYIKRAMPDLYAWNQDRYTDWQEVLIGGTAYRNTAQLSFSGGNEQTQFLFSGGYQNETTVFPGDSKYGKASVNISINHQSVDKRLQINVSTNYVVDDNHLPGIGFTRIAYRLAPNAPALYDDNGDLNWENSTWENPLARLGGKYRAQSNNLLLNSVISFCPIQALEFKTNLGYTDYHKKEYRTYPHMIRDPDFGHTSATSSIVNTNSASRQSWIVEPQINWKKDWNKTSLNILVGATFQQQQSNQISHSAIGFPNNRQILDLSAADQLTVLLDHDKEYNYQSVFGRINFKWDGKYIMNLTGRRDGSSRFGPSRQFGDFGAIGTAWLFSEEAFMEDNRVLSFGKLRSSYGITGSDNVVDYGFYDSYETTSGANYNGSVIQPTRLFNPFFAWEENKKFEVALELGFLEDRLMLTTAWYKNRSSNQLVGIPLPGTTGFNSVNANFDATVENTGLEVNFRSVNIQNKHFKWMTTFNISVPKNKLVKFDGLETSTFASFYEVGEPLSIIKLNHMIGVDPDTGVYQFEDYNNDGVIGSGFTFVDRQDRQLIERTEPEFFGGMGNTISYKTWTLDVFFEFKKQRGADVSYNGSAPGGFSNQNIFVLNRWQQVGDEAPIQRYTLGIGQGADAGVASSNYNDSSARYTDISFIRLRNISLTYVIPKEYVSGMDASIYLQGQNLLTFTKSQKANPEHGGGSYLPLLRQFTLGLQLGF